LLCKPDDKLVRSLEAVGDDVYAITYDGAKNYKLVHTSLKNPDWTHADLMAAEKPDQTLESITHCKDFLLMTYSDGINNHLVKYNFKTKVATAIKLPNQGTVDVSCANQQSNDCIVNITSWNQPFTEYNYNAATDAFAPGSFNKPAVYPAAYKDLQVEEVEVKGHDGVMIPLSIIYRKGVKKDGTNVCLIEGYGAYGFSMTPYFDYRMNSLAVKGTVIAYPHVRGGSERGQEWYKGGYKLRSPTLGKTLIVAPNI